MNKIVFLKELELSLNKLKASEIEKHINYYDEMISDYMENGMSEESAVERIGNPKMIAKELMEGYDSIKITMPGTGSRILNIVLLILGFPLWGSLLLSAVLLLLSFYIVLWCIPFATGASGIGFFAASIVGIIGSPFVMVNSVSVGIIQLGAGIASIGISTLFIFATIILYRKIIILTKNFNKKLKGMFWRRVKYNEN